MPTRQTVIVTGGNSGLGFACARALLQSSGYHVVIACRDAHRAEVALAQLRRGAVGSGAVVEAMSLDLASLASVRAFADAVADRISRGDLPPLRGLVCNAGFQGAKQLTEDGFERTFGINHLGHYLVVNLLLSHLTAPARIVVVASGVHDPAQMAGLSADAAMPPPAWNTPEALARGELGTGGAGDSETADRGRRYATSKLANVYFTYALARRLPGGVVANAFDPGLMPGTGLAREYPPLMRFLWRSVLPKILPVLRMLVTKNIHTPEVSGAALARLITDPALVETNGRYFEGTREIRSSDASYDEARQEELWEASAGLTGISAALPARASA